MGLTGGETVNRFIACAAVVLAACSAACAEPVAQQHAVQSWHGLTGLYVVPTARMIEAGRLSYSYNESKHVEWIGSPRFVDRQVRASITYGVSDNVEIYGGYVRDLLNTGDGFRPVLDNQTFNQFGFKWRFLSETKRRPAVAIAVRDLFNDMQDIEPLRNVNNGRKFFLLMSKRVVEDQATGRFLDAHAGLTKDDLKTSGLFGIELALTPNVSYIAEGMWDSPYLNFRGIYLNPAKTGVSNVPGRFIFDMGLRFYPDLIPGFVIDTGVVADGQPEFSFGFSYTTGI